MGKAFQESEEFVRWATDNLSLEQFVELQNLLMANPNAGKVIKGGRGIRKLRFKDRSRGKGTRGGFRIIYLHIPEVDWIFLIDAYGKDEKDDLEPWQVDVLAQLAARYRELALQRGRKRDWI